MQWKVFFASATGKQHLDGNSPCQDAGHHLAVNDVLIGVVCDGAGSASQGHLGADFFARRLTELVSASLRSGQFALDTQLDYRDFLVPIIEAARTQLNEVAVGKELVLRDFACTVVGCIASRGRGCFFHIGDGFGICVRNTGESVLSQPENGEYADQTYFVTDERWQDHLRLTPLPDIQQGSLIGLMSDGASPFAVNRAKTGFFPPFIDPVVSFLSNATEHGGSEALQQVLESEKTYAITADDKTLLLALAS